MQRLPPETDEVSPPDNSGNVCIAEVSAVEEHSLSLLMAAVATSALRKELQEHAESIVGHKIRISHRKMPKLYGIVAD